MVCEFFILWGRVSIVYYIAVFVGFYIKFGKNQVEVVDKGRILQYFILKHLRKDRGGRLGI